MAYVPGNFDAVHAYLQWGGSLPGGETWSCGLRLAGNAAFTSDDVDAYANFVQGYHASAQTYISGAAKLQYVKFNPIGVNGRYLFQTTTQREINNIGGAGPNPAAHPNQVALAISLTTAFSRGAAHRGRFYIPLPCHPVDGNGLISIVDATAGKSSAQGFINGLNSVNSGYQVAVFSRKSGAATHRLVQGCEVGRVLDTQRRRRRSMAEGYI